MNKKICTKCKKELLANTEYFSKAQRGKLGLSAVCKDCIKIYTKSRSEQKRLYDKIRYKKNIEEIKKYNKEHYKKNREIILLKVKNYRANNIDKVKKCKEKWRRKKGILSRKKLSKEELSKRKKEYLRNYYLKNIGKHKEYAKSHKNKRNINRNIRYKNDINYKIEQLLRSRIHKVLKLNSKSEKTREFIGCSIPELKIYLKKQFKVGMNWENFGQYGWHIDHIKPCSLFDLSKSKQQKLCFHYKNLQPLWWYENIKKSNNFEKKSDGV